MEKKVNRKKETEEEQNKKIKNTNNKNKRRLEVEQNCPLSKRKKAIDKKKGKMYSKA